MKKGLDFLKKIR